MKLIYKNMKYLKLFEEWHKVVSKKSDSGKTKWVDTILDDPTSPKSLSSGILLKRDLEKEEFDDLKNLTGLQDYEVRDIARGKLPKQNKKLEDLKVTLNNLQFLKDKHKELGELYCEYCKKGPLVIYDINPSKSDLEKYAKDSSFRFNKDFKKSDGATADHKQPKSKGGDKFDYSNLAVCCYNCNSRKANMDWESWKKLIKL
jgi:hypothetical protein